MRIALAVLLLALPAFADSSVARRQAVEQSLLGPVIVEGEQGMSLIDRMRFYDVPGMSIAVWRDGKVDWSRGYGVVARGDVRRVDERTLFQAGSISKSFTSVATQRVLARRGIPLNTRVNDLLRSWKLPGGDGVTVERILSHTAGLNVQGFPGFERGEARPSLVEELQGRGASITDPLRVELAPGTKVRYSGGGYLLLQQMLADVERRPYAEIVTREVLQPAGMNDSTFAQPLPRAMLRRATGGVTEDLDVVPIGGRIYPEQAAAGLSTTASDLARFAIALQDARLLDAEQTATMFAPFPATGNRLGLGVFLWKKGDATYVVHPGGNAGFVAIFVAHATKHYGAAILINRENSEGLAFELLRGIAKVYGWESYLPPAKTLAHLSAEELAKFKGRYRIDADDVLTVRADGDHLIASHTLGPELRLDPLTATTFIRRDEEETIDLAVLPRATDAVPTERVATGDIAGGVAALRALDAAVLDDERLRTRGAELRKRGQSDAALALLAFNVERHATSAAAWDALMRAQLAAGRRDDARESATHLVEVMKTDPAATASWRAVYRKRAAAAMR
jgi:CubicO group peptidase (beta-lactamase class C family)